MSLGIGIITYKRPAALMRTINKIKEFTTGDYHLIVAEDGGNDSSVSLAKEADVQVITGNNRGVCWNKNRALYAFMEYTACDPILLLEDDCWPEEEGWQENWIKAAENFNHINFAYIIWAPLRIYAGEGTADAPWLSVNVTGQSTITTREALTKVGYLNTSFKGYGHGHVEWSERFAKAALIKKAAYPCIIGDLRVEHLDTFRNNADVRRNEILYRRLKSARFIYTDPWNNETERTILENEVRTGLQIQDSNESTFSSAELKLENEALVNV